MPVSVGNSVPQHLRPYSHHGIFLDIRGAHAVGDCPFCGKEGKFSVHVDTGLWRCFVCGGGTDSGGGNAITFLRKIHEASVTSTSDNDIADFARIDRKLISPGTLVAWGVCRSSIDGAWLVPGYGADGSMDQLYRRVILQESWRLLPTPGVWGEGKVHALHLPKCDFDPTREYVDVFEGPWDGMAWWELKHAFDRAVNTNVIAVPGASTWREEWTELCRGKKVTIWFDSDYITTPAGKLTHPGWDGTARASKKLSGIAGAVSVLRWGPDGCDMSRPSGYDVRDHLSVGGFFSDRTIPLMELNAKIEAAPAEWFIAGQINVHPNGHSRVAVPAQECFKWDECETAWKDALLWRSDLGDALAVMLAVCASTQQGGNQLFFQVVGSAGSAKTTLCEGLLVSGHCHHLEHLTGFHSGWKADDGKDCSLISRINGKTLITPEADIMMSSPRFQELMSQQRRIFDGKSGATYKNTSVDTLYEGLRTPWIMAGTPALLDTDQSRLGDRFQRIIISSPAEDEKRAILRKALKSERAAMLEQANGTSASLVEPKLRKAHALTGGYVDWLRANIENELSLVAVGEPAEETCIDLAELSADMRARPNEDRNKKEVHDSKELPTRLSRQNIRLATCLAVVLNKKEVDAEVLRKVRKVALDTSGGHSLNIVKWMLSHNTKVPGNKTFQECGGIPVDTLAVWAQMTPERMSNYLLFLRKIDVLVWREQRQTNGYWMLTPRVHELYTRIMGEL